MVFGDCGRDTTPGPSLRIRFVQDVDVWWLVAILARLNVLGLSASRSSFESLRINDGRDEGDRYPEVTRDLGLGDVVRGIR